MILLEAMFWVAAGVIAYTYLVFPLLLALRSLLAPRPYRTAAITPPVSLIIAAHNEADAIGAKLDNVLALDYPSDRLEVIVASDGSDDATNEIVRRYEARGVRLLALPRQGKAPALNAAVAAAGGEVLVFSDANSMYTPGAIRALVRPFADENVGGVAGNQRYLSEGRRDDRAAGETSYWRLDRVLKKLQDRAGNAISATGAIYAIRRDLFQPVPAGVTDDFITSTRVIAQGRRLVFAPDAVALEPAAGTSGREFGRKVRVMTRGLRGVWMMRELLNPFRHGFYAVQMLSHKVLRRLVAFPLIAVAVLAPLLWSEGLAYRLATVGQAAFYALALGGLALGRTRWGTSKLLGLPFFFCMVNAAAVVATIHVVRGHRIELWEPQRQDAA